MPVFRWVPRNMTDSMMRAILKNDATAQKIKQAVAKKLRAEGETDLDFDSAIKVEATSKFIRVTIDKTGGASSALNEVALDDFIPEYDAEEFLYGKGKSIDDSDEDPDGSLKQYDKDIKSIIEEVVKGVAPLEMLND